MWFESFGLLVLLLALAEVGPILLAWECGLLLVKVVCSWGLPIGGVWVELNAGVGGKVR